MRGERGSPESEREAEDKEEGRRGSGKGQEPFNRPGAIVDNCTASLPDTDGGGASKSCDGS